MTSLLLRLQNFLARWIHLSSSTRASSSTIVVTSETKDGTNIERTVCVVKDSTILRLHSEDVGPLKENSVGTVIQAYSSFKTTLKEVSITHHTNLERIPTSIGLFVNLTKLDLSSNSLSDLPLSVVYLRALKTLDLSNNLFCSVPPIIGHLYSLERLLLNKNHLQYLPTSLLNLTSLKTLEVSGNNNMIAPSAWVCMLGTKAILSHMSKRLGRTDTWSHCRQYYTDATSDSDVQQSVFQMKSLLEQCVVTVLKFEIDYLTQMYIPPPLKRHLHDASVAKLRAVKLFKCSKCGGFYSSQAYFDDHDCR